MNVGHRYGTEKQKNKNFQKIRTIYPYSLNETMLRGTRSKISNALFKVSTLRMILRLEHLESSSSTIPRNCASPFVTPFRNPRLLPSGRLEAVRKIRSRVPRNFRRHDPKGGGVGTEGNREGWEGSRFLIWNAPGVPVYRDSWSVRNENSVNYV